MRIMSSRPGRWPLAVLLLLVAAIGLSNGEDTTTNDELGSTAGDIIRKRGFLAEEHFVTTEDGAILSVWHARNPLLERPTKGVVLFIHGTVTNPQGLVMDSVGARPKDYSSLNASQFSDEELVELLGEDPASNSLVFTALNWGWDVWMMSKRGTRRSQGHTSALNQPYRNPILTLGQILLGGSPLWPAGLSAKPLSPNASTVPTGPPTMMTKQVNQDTDNPLLGPLLALSSIRFNLTYLSLSANPRYWSFSLDEQARYDVPAVMLYILNVTGQPKLTLVGHSSGAALILMALIDQPELDELIEQAICWAPALDLGNDLRDGNLVVATLIEGLFLPLATTYVGPIPPGFLVTTVQALLATLCESELSQKLLCETITDLLAGPSGFENKIKAGFPGALLESVGSQEIAHLIQSINKNRMHYFDYGTSQKNTAVYGVPSPPPYQPARITCRTISLWTGKDDVLVTPGDTKIFLSDVQVPIEMHLLPNDSQRFNHISFLLHQNISRILILPSLKRMETPFQL